MNHALGVCDTHPHGAGRPEEATLRHSGWSRAVPPPVLPPELPVLIPSARLIEGLHEPRRKVQGAADPLQCSMFP